jgi:type I restriction enzyme S subunit
MIASCNENEYEKFILKKGQVAITKDSETPNDIGVSTYISEDFEDVVLGYHLALITPDKDKLNGRFLHYWLNTKQAKRYFENNAGGSGQRCTLVLDCIKSTPLYLPNLSTQEKIAKVLSDLDAKIELNNRINRELEAMAKTLYDYWFVQFDFPNEQGKTYKSSGGKMVYNAELKREIPKGWEVKKLSDIANITTGKLDSNAEVKAGKFYFYTCAENPTRTDSYAFDDSVILVAGNNASGNFHINRYTGKFNAYQRTYIVTENEEYYLDYLFQVFERQLKVLKTRGQGSQTKFLTIGMLTEIPVFQTNSSLMESFHKIANPLYLRQLNVLNENQQLTELRDWLLPMLMNVQVTVKEAEERFSMAAEPNVEYKKG